MDFIIHKENWLLVLDIYIIQFTHGFYIHKENWLLVLDIYIIQFTHGFYHP